MSGVAPGEARGRWGHRIRFLSRVHHPLVWGVRVSDPDRGDGVASRSSSRSVRISDNRSRKKVASVSALAARSRASARCIPDSWRFPSWSMSLSHASLGTSIDEPSLLGPVDRSGVDVVRGACRLSRCATDSGVTIHCSPCEPLARTASTEPPRDQARKVETRTPKRCSASRRLIRPSMDGSALVASRRRGGGRGVG